MQRKVTWAAIGLALVAGAGWMLMGNAKPKTNTPAIRPVATERGGVQVSNAPIQSVDVTSKLELLGRAFNKSPYANNVWDMQQYNGKIYLGHGNSSNTGPAQNAGPIPVVYYDATNAEFQTQAVTNSNPSIIPSTKMYVDEEQIDLYKVLNGKLYIPGHDSDGESWDFGNFYRLDEGTWTKYRNLPKGVHVYDLAYYQGKLFAALGTETKPTVLISHNDGQSWQQFATINTFGFRAYTLFEIQGKLYASGMMYPANKIWNDKTNILEINERLEKRDVAIYGNKMLPGLTYQQGTVPYNKIGKNINFNNKLVYIAGGVFNDSQLLPKSLNVMTDINQARRVSLADANALPTDLLVRDDKVYVLTYTRKQANVYVSRVYQTNDLTTWNEILRFTQDTYAKSFEELDGDFYFGLGTDPDVLSPSSGKILRVNRVDIPVNSN
ncbi:hypothetical protein NKT34_12875 [Paenibacillus polysaccharolyticus]|uniref:BNR repeat-containing family member n=1 Tax=Paenibacillus polysaccharolyticus TaxID=582692 RepID=A0A1G5KZA2_9BACL|nr:MULTISPECIES: hypothetical protein [Paenibacillus]MCP1134189.1 hypothetical protein [Paenibacillus polysaccharolyticus]SCZ05664.1 hypothetical protein SAMN05720606_11820 [Paenibacillus polysaccharolyticus]